MANDKEQLSNATEEEKLAAAPETGTETEPVYDKPESGFSRFFKLRENRTKLTTEIIAGVTTFFTMAYIIFVNPNILAQKDAAGLSTLIPWGGAFLATIIAAIIGTLIMGLFANVPYAQAPGMGLNAFFVFTVCFSFGFTWEAALAMVFICGIINVVITVTKIRKHLVKAIPKNLQLAIGAGIGLFIAYIGLKGANLLTFTADPGAWDLIIPGGTPDSSGITTNGSIIPALAALCQPDTIVCLFGLILTVILLVKKVKGGILIGIAASTLLAVIFSACGWGTVVNFSYVSFSGDAFVQPFKDLGKTFGAAFYQGFPSLFSDPAKLPIALLAIFAFSLTDTFDTIGTFLGTGRKTGIFSAEDEKVLETGIGFKSRMDKALLADAVATSIGAVFGTSNTTTYVESAAGIEAGGRTGLTSVVTAICFFLCIFISPIAGIVPAAATAPALIVVGIMMASSLKEIEWGDFAEAVPAFLTVALMSFAYSISTGMAVGFILYVIIKSVQGKAKTIHPILWGATALFVLYFVFMALHGAGLF